MSTATSAVPASVPRPRMAAPPTAQEHLVWTRERALEILDLSGDPYKAFCSFYDDLGKHPDLTDHMAIQLARSEMVMGTLVTADDMRRFIRAHVR